MAWSHRMGIRGFLIAGFLVVAPLMAVFQGPLQDRFETLFKRDTPKSATIASADTGTKPAQTATGFRPVIRGEAPASGDIAASRPRFPDEPEESPSDGIDENRKRRDEPLATSTARNSTDTDSLIPSDDGSTAGRRPARKDFEEVQTEFQNRDPIAESPGRRLTQTDPDHQASEGRKTAGRKAAQGNLIEKGRDDRHDLAVAEDDVMEKAGGGHRASATDPLARPYAKLRDLGATSSRLETWGADGDRYRFQCRVATDPDETEARHFEATDEQPLRAIEKVVQQVEAWQGQRR